MIWFLFLLLIIWILCGYINYLMLYKKSKEVYNEVLEYMKEENSYKDMNQSVKFFIPRLELQQKYPDLLDFYTESKSHPFKHIFITVPKFLALGPIFFFINQ